MFRAFTKSKALTCGGRTIPLIPFLGFARKGKQTFLGYLRRKSRLIYPRPRKSARDFANFRGKIFEARGLVMEMTMS